jgi:hypothetical protein
MGWELYSIVPSCSHVFSLFVPVLGIDCVHIGILGFAIKAREMLVYIVYRETRMQTQSCWCCVDSLHVTSSPSHSACVAYLGRAIIANQQLASDCVFCFVLFWVSYCRIPLRWIRENIFFFLLDTSSLKFCLSVSRNSRIILRTFCFNRELIELMK